MAWCSLYPPQIFRQHAQMSIAQQRLKRDVDSVDRDSDDPRQPARFRAKRGPSNGHDDRLRVLSDRERGQIVRGDAEAGAHVGQRVSRYGMAAPQEARERGVMHTESARDPSK